MGSQTSPNASPDAKSFLIPSLNRFAVVVAFFPAFVLGFAAIAGDASAETAKVAYGDLNLSSPAGAKALLHRIEAAAGEACAPALLHSPLVPRAEAEFSACKASAVNSTVKSLNSPLLASLLRGEDSEPSLALAAR